ncbi:hypothetical protein AKN87_07185 [Thiopseudomonas alkaliphila]|uniref:integrating conjugative element protein n=1 Tax=Thiopseudomonas alkaliphila TaxID=1697053 RepID=UPI00069E9308|nr:integrating conjugative element protein [Thiopseudomonas alkaliphila]AKX44902.1 hypothetical protein AKN87_07185 [Thiopseudomonas alkaliphila]AKX51371.1 hypothetical protein AKN92_07600 [Thiopseudomonas alkaliphila]AKX57713.1 hypothetical protein AKN89_07765 [Thiopseudomonas alkaliphila]
MKRFLLLLSSCIATVTASASTNSEQSNPLVIHQGGVSALRYYDSLSVESGEKAIRPLPDIHLQKPGQFSAFPVVSKLTPGAVKAKTLSASGLVQPIFMIGYDKHSAQWLSERYHILKELNALGLVVNVPTAEAMAELQKIAPDLMLQPIPGDDLAKHIGVKHYPVLITKTSIEQ